MKKYTDSVRRGLNLIDNNMRIYAMDKRDEKDPEGEDVVAALDWIAAQEQRAKRAAAKRVPNEKIEGSPLVGDPSRMEGSTHDD